MTMTIEIEGLENSIPANNVKIIEIFNKLRSGGIYVNKDYQRKLVWKKQHKFNFIETILKNYPFPEVYLAPGILDQEKLILIDEIVDGQQRLTTIRDYIQELDAFALPKIPIKKFSELTPTEKTAFLNYEVSVRYLKKVSPEQIKEIFQRINKTDYALNATERLNAKWGESEFICFSKQIIEENFDSDGVQYLIPTERREAFLKFFHGDDDNESVFSINDNSRMLALQYIMTLIATLDQGEYFSRNEKLSSYIEGFNDAFPQAADIENRLISVVNFLTALMLDKRSRWFNKANLFSLIVELDKFDLETLSGAQLKMLLEDFDHRAALYEFGLAEKETLSSDESRYLELAKEAVNQKSAREFRGKILNQMLSSSKLPSAQA